MGCSVVIQINPRAWGPVSTWWASKETQCSNQAWSVPLLFLPISKNIKGYPVLNSQHRFLNFFFLILLFLKLSHISKLPQDLSFRISFIQLPTPNYPGHPLPSLELHFSSSPPFILSFLISIQRAPALSADSHLSQMH